MWPRARELPPRLAALPHGRLLRSTAGLNAGLNASLNQSGGLLFLRHSTARSSPVRRLGPVHTHLFTALRPDERQEAERAPRPFRKLQAARRNPALRWKRDSKPLGELVDEQECQLPMDMECGCKTKRIKEQQEQQALELAAAKKSVVQAAPAAVEEAVETTSAVVNSVVVTRSTSPVGTSVVPFQSSFHRRHLPQDCIAFSGPEGRKLFTEAINSRGENYMQIYFPLAEQFITQAEPAFCGLATLAMCLNALQIDPGRLWKGPWRWFSEELFDCCTSLAVAKEKGISMSEFICLARCNGVQTEDFRASPDFTLDQFRDIVKRSCATSSEIVVLNYSRKVLGQTGDGHFSPIGGYHAERDMVLLMDVARFKYPPHWVRLSLVYEAMQRIDQSSGTPRGLVVLREGAHATGPTLVKQQLVHADEKSTADIKPAPSPCCNSATAVESARRVSDALAQSTAN